MTVYPEVQQKAQAELDRVVGPSRLPTFKDRADLPYIEAVIKEIHRWIPVGPLGIFGVRLLSSPCADSHCSDSSQADPG